MSVPGNSILIVALLAVFVACCGYAAGRIHQRRQTGDDREAAYRDGYEKGSHSVFSLAARMIVPRRPVRAAAPVKPESDAGQETTLLPKLRASGSGAPAGGSSLGGSSLGAPSVGGSSVGGLSSAASLSVASSLGAPTPVAPSPIAPSPVSPAQAAPSLLGRSPLGPSSGTPSPLAASPGATSPGAQSPAAPSPGDPAPSEAPGSDAAARSLSGADMAQMGFPVPPPPPNATVPEPPAVGGVRFQRFPDPRTGVKTTVLPDMSDSKARREGDRVPEPRRAAGHRAPEDEQDTVATSPSAPAGESGTPVPTGRHGVPDELVQAATYRLPPDRVFRAKVRDSANPPDDPTTKLVPKPRQS